MRSLSLSLVFVWCSAWASGGGGEGGEAAPPSGALPKDQKEYIEKTGKLTTLANRIAEHEKNFAAIVHHKSIAKDVKEKQHLIGELNAVAKERNKDVEAYNRIKMEVKLRYPNQGIALDRHYGTQQKKSVEEMEQVAGLDQMLTRVKRVIDKKYEQFLVEEEKANNLQPAVVKSAEEEKPKRLKLEK